MSSIRTLAKRSATLTGLVRDLRRLSAWPHHIAARRRDRRRIAHYLAGRPVRKLQLGSGQSVDEGWLCTDKNIFRPELVQLDVTRRFPLDDGCIDYIYSEHMIEHITRPQASYMLRESWRVLRPGGKIRTATPDLRVLAALTAEVPDPAGVAYMQWLSRLAPAQAPEPTACYVLNVAFRHWGHRFLYDRETLTAALHAAGFEDVRSVDFGQSEDEHLRGLECHGEHAGDAAMVRFETMILEATKPA